MTVLPDVLAPNLAIVFCGTAVGNVSAQRGAYYAGPGNMFWPTLFAVGLTPRLLQPEEFREVLSYGLGLTDLVKAVAGVDTQLSDNHFDQGRLRATILHYEPAILAFTSKRAGSEFLDRPCGAPRSGRPPAGVPSQLPTLILKSHKSVSTTEVS